MKLVRFALNFALGTVLSRVLGFVRDATVAYYFGASHISDAFFIAFRIPNSFRRLLGEGGFNAAFVPLYTKALERGEEREFLSKVLGLYLLANLAFTFLGVVLSEEIVSLIAPGIRDGETFSLAVFMARFLFLYLLLVGVNALFMGILNVRGRFFVPAFSQGVFNAVFVLVLLLFAEPYGYLSLIAGVLLGGLLQVLVNVPLLLKERVSLSLSLSLDEEVKTLLRRLIPALGGFGVNQLSLFIDTFLASFLRTGAISYLYYANRIYQLPFGVVSVGVANSLLSILSRRSVSRRRELTEALRLVFLLTLPASAGLFLLSEDIVMVVYRRGSFGDEDVFFSSGALSIYSLGLVLFSFQKVLSAVLFSEGDTKTPVKASLLTVLSEGVLASFFAFLLKMGVFGLPMGTALSSLVGFAYLISKVDVSPDWRSLLKSSLKGFLATTLMGALVFFLKRSELEPLMVVLTAVPLGALAYFLSLIALREELSLRLLKGFVEKLRNP